MKTKTSLAVGLAVLLGAGGLFVHQMEAARPGGSGGKYRGLFAQKMIERYELTDDQVAQIKKVRNEEKDYVLDKLGDLHAARVQLRSAIHQPKVNEPEVRAAHAKVAAVEADLAVERAKVYAKISPILTEEQKGRIKADEKRFDANVDWLLKNIGSHPALND